VAEWQSERITDGSMKPVGAIANPSGWQSVGVAEFPKV